MAQAEGRTRRAPWLSRLSVEHLWCLHSDDCRGLEQPLGGPRSRRPVRDDDTNLSRAANLELRDHILAIEIPFSGPVVTGGQPCA